MGEMGYAAAQVVIFVLDRAGRDLTLEKFLTAMEGIHGYQDIFGSPPISLSSTDHHGSTLAWLAVVKNSRWIPAVDHPLGYDCEKGRTWLLLLKGEEVSRSAGPFSSIRHLDGRSSLQRALMRWDSSTSPSPRDGYRSVDSGTVWEQPRRSHVGAVEQVIQAPDTKPAIAVWLQKDTMRPTFV